MVLGASMVASGHPPAASRQDTVHAVATACHGLTK